MMMPDKKTVLTLEGLKKLEDELQELKVVRRKDVAGKIKEARSQGDLSENAEYDAAKEEQAEIESRIALIEKMLRHAEVIDEDELDTDSVMIGSRVKLKDLAAKEDVEYMIVGSTEADPIAGRISNESPLGAKLLGCKKGETVAVDAPHGVFKYKILEIL
jgi:transcription elongation factor GreA